MNKSFFYSLILILLLSASGELLAQASSERDYYNWFDAQIGIENTGIFNGIRYKELYRVNDGKHKFYKSPEYLTGNLVYDGQPYYDIQLKYDLFEDELIIELQTSSGSSILKLLKDEVDAFEIDDRNFRHLRNTRVYKSNDRIDGFYEVLTEGTSMTLLKKHRKTRKKVLENRTVLSEFLNDDAYYVYYQDLFYPIKNKNDLIKIFPGIKKQINDFYSGSKYLMKTDYDLFMIQVSERIDSALTSNSSRS